MAGNPGKIFEAQIRDSAPDYALVHRLQDPAQSFGGGGGNTRFSRRNPFDYLMFNPMRGVLFAIEAKSVAGKSISFERTKDDHGEIHAFQADGLRAWSAYDRVISGFLIEFRKIETTVFLYIESFDWLIESISKKSFNFDDIVESGLPYLIIPQRKLRTRYRYDIDKLLTEAKEIEHNE